MKKLAGSYKGKRKRMPPPQIVVIECPACGWKGHAGKINEAEAEYLLHLVKVHHGSGLRCAFCGEEVSAGLSVLPDFATLAHHVKVVHGQGDGENLPPRSFR